MKKLGMFGLLILVAYIASTYVSHRPAPQSAIDQTKGIQSKKCQTVDQCPALPDEQKRKILAILKRTDELDKIYKAKIGMNTFFTQAKAIEDDLAAFEPTMDQGDPRRDLLVNCFSKYQNAGLLLAQHKNADATIFAAYIPKKSLRDWLNGTLTKEEKNFINTWLRSN